ncbi:MAG: DUF4465 domain-containing protein [Bacteroidales bacterium]|nr:DUF4465 domain-containing protein [Bacteroidales bacterium]
MTKKFLSMAAIAALCASCMTSCDDDDDDAITTITFEEFGLAKDSVSIGYDVTEKNITFDNFYSDDYYGMPYNSGFTLSSMTDMETAGYMNQYSVYATSGAGNSTAFVIYNFCSDSCFIKAKTAFEPKSVDVCLTTYTYLSAKNGDDYAKKFGNDDWFAATFTGYDESGSEVGSVEVKLIDGASWMDSWTNVDLSELGKVNKIFISFDGSDKGDWGLNTPAYIALDNLKVKF